MENMNAAGDCLNLFPQPLPCVVKSKKLSIKEELEFNKSRLVEIKNEKKFMKERIKRLSEILRKEVGEETDIKELLRQGSSAGWQSRAQMIMTLRIKLIAMRSKFLDPPHKMYYRGPFDPKKEFELKFLPQKQESLYERMLAEKKNRILQHNKPVDVLQKELDDLFLMQRAARFRTKSLTCRVENSSKELDKAKEKAEYKLRVIEAMMAHQTLFKMMIEPESFRLDPEMKKHIKCDALEPNEISEWKRFKMAFGKTQKEINLFREALFTITDKLDEITKNLIESKRIDVVNRLSFGEQNTPEAPTKDKAKGKDKGKVKEQTDTENEYKLLVEENRQLRQFLISSVLVANQDFRLFVDSLDGAMQEFINTVQEINEVNRDS